MRILAISLLFPNIISPNYGIFVLNRLKAINKYAEIKVINPIPWFPGNRFLRRYKNYDMIPKREIIDGMEVFHPRFFSIPRYFKLVEIITFFAPVFTLLTRIKQEFPFDLIDIHWIYPDLPAAFIISKIFHKKRLVTIRGKEALFSGGKLRYEIGIRPFLKRSDTVITLSKELASLCERDGLKRSKIHVIFNGVDTQNFYYMDKAFCRNKLKLPLHEKIVLSVGSLIYGKGHDRLIKIFPKILEKYPEAVLYIVGSHGPEGDNRKELLRLVREYSLGGKVNFVGSIKNCNLPLWYNGADIFCLASRGEGSPNVLSEALACGCPSLATNVGSVPEILSEKFMGEIVENKDEAILPALLSILGRKYDRKKIANHMKQYDWDWCARKVIKVYKSVLRNGL